MVMCQSCGMPLKQDSDKGTEKDGSLSTEYCHFCYQNGSFVGPDCTLAEMKVICKKAMQEKGLNPLLIWISLATMGNLKRWKQA